MRGQERKTFRGWKRFADSITSTITITTTTTKTITTTTTFITITSRIEFRAVSVFSMYKSYVCEYVYVLESQSNVNFDTKLTTSSAFIYSNSRHVFFLSFFFSLS